MPACRHGGIGRARGYIKIGSEAKLDTECPGDMFHGPCRSSWRWSAIRSCTPWWLTGYEALAIQREGLTERGPEAAKPRAQPRVAAAVRPAMGALTARIRQFEAWLAHSNHA